MFYLRRHHCIMKLQQLQNIQHCRGGISTSPDGCQYLPLIIFKPLTHNHVFLDKLYLLVCTAGQVLSPVQATKLSLTSFICWCVQHRLTTFSLFKSWCDQLLNKTPCQGNTCSFMLYTRTNIKLVKGILVKGNLVVCMGLYNNC